MGRRAVAASLTRSVVSAALLVVGYFLVPLERADPATWIWLTISLAVWAVVCVRQVLAVLASPTPRLRVVEALGLTVPLLLVVFALTYAALGRVDAAAFTEPIDRVDALYFTVTVFATVGIGDIAPVSTTARVVTTLQMVFGLVAVGLIARVLLGAASVSSRRHGHGDG
ncbi:potassium channel family protein [Saccharomonospora sp. NB11]|uniref:potassium channel family protein n=1 Tax=Saccharomonospora sp. NB11 TaxID=1642298 RepID=UPI0027DE3C4E|nr:potassium channel family protein [Saccharomonospora sp. NB11]